MNKNWIVLIIILLLAIFLRFYKLGEVPPSPYWEEVALGYDAYSILETGKDHHGNPWPIVAFESFGDWKPSLYFYAAVPSIAVFGLNTFAVRFPSALAGVMTVGLIFFLVKELLNNPPFRKGILEWFPLVSAFFLAIMPWHILVSRVAFETNLGLFLVVLGSWLFVKFQVPSSKFQVVWLLSSAIVFGLSMYAYHGNRVFVPLLLIVFSICYLIFGIKNKLDIKKIFGQLFVLGGVFLLLSLPVVLKMTDPQVSKRFAETSAFATLDPILASNQAITEGGNTAVARLIHHRYWYYAGIFVRNYVSHFDPQFLLVSGDINPRHSVGVVGQMYWIMGVLGLVGLLGMLVKKEWRLLPMVAWLFLAPVAAGFTKAVPHALRALPMVVPVAVFVGYGLGVIANLRIKRKYTNIRINTILVIVIIVISFFELFRFWSYYLKAYPAKTAEYWQYGYQQLMEYVGTEKNNYDSIYITREYGRPAMYYWFFNQIDPRQVQAWDGKAEQDQGEYLQFENLYFGSQAPEEARQLRVEMFRPENGQIVQIIKDVNGEELFYAYQQ